LAATCSLGWASVRGEAGATQAVDASSSALTETRCSPPLHSRTRTRSGSFAYQPTTSPSEPSAMPSVSEVKRILSPCLKEQSSDRVGELLVDIPIFIGSEALWLKPEERKVAQRSEMSPDGHLARRDGTVAREDRRGLEPFEEEPEGERCLPEDLRNCKERIDR